MKKTKNKLLLFYTRLFNFFLIYYIRGGNMKCLFCGNTDTKVIDSRTNEDVTSIRRRRECPNCGKRFTTFEVYETIPIMVIKKDGSRESFDREKIRKGMVKACEKRPVTMAQIEQVVSTIEKSIYNSLLQEVSSKEIGEEVMKHLKQLDEVAYVRFASVYKQFTDIDNFIELLKKLKR